MLLYSPSFQEYRRALGFPAQRPQKPPTKGVHLRKCNSSPMILPAVSWAVCHNFLKLWSFTSIAPVGELVQKCLLNNLFSEHYDT